MPVSQPTVIRPCTPGDLPEVTEIYRFHVLQGTGTFEIDAPNAAEMSRRHAEVRAKGLPWLVAEVGSAVKGYAYANHFRPRPAYRFCCEDSIYIAPDAERQGLGKSLLAELLTLCEAQGARQMLAVIGDAANLGSIAVHRALGFEPAGTLHAVGWKFERWLDVVLMQKRLGLGSIQAASEPAA
jgi:L-amino acid N-acyltransferase YncA